MRIVGATDEIVAIGKIASGAQNTQLIARHRSMPSACVPQVQLAAVPAACPGGPMSRRAECDGLVTV